MTIAYVAYAIYNLLFILLFDIDKRSQVKLSLAEADHELSIC